MKNVSIRNFFNLEKKLIVKKSIKMKFSRVKKFIIYISFLLKITKTVSDRLKYCCFEITSPSSKYLAPFCVVSKTPRGLQLKSK